ncbi:MAG: hypothetical protein ACQKBV_13320 [Puniceicoccales bacterium]
MNSPNDSQREPTPEELAKAERATWILYGVMIIFIVAPFIVFWLVK